MNIPDTVKQEATKLGVSKYFTEKKEDLFSFSTEDYEDIVGFESKSSKKKVSVSPSVPIVLSTLPDQSKIIDKEEELALLKENSNKAFSFAVSSIQGAKSKDSKKGKKDSESEGNKEVNVLFSDYVDIKNRKMIINNMILSGYSFNLKDAEKEKGKGKKQDKDDLKEKEDISESKEEDAKEDKPTKVEKPFQLNFELDAINTKHINDLKLQIRLAMSTLETRELANTRADIATPDYMAEYAKNLVETHNIEYEERASLKLSKTSKAKESKERASLHIIEGEELRDKGYNLIYNVGKAAVSKPKILAIQYNGLPESRAITHAIIGKGLTFDTGGLNLKPASGMDTMFYDKHGACNTLAIFNSIAKLGLKINAVFVVGLAENSVDSVSYRPSDILISKKGLTVEVGNTDAEGRLVLADCLTYTQEKFKPKVIVDLATLTGACKVALGSKTAGLFSNDDTLAGSLINASKVVDESVWKLPISDNIRDSVKGNYSDIKSTGKNVYAGASFAAAFLEKFVDKGVKWAHLDIAGPAYSGAKNGNFSAGA
eukprot:CAMPEP_0170519510 /NCGR_PEP_ID=MMETSP0209-20121228/4902_1 /TAXON_ID=665100 ORGANISM="Litonotus pictus, Strain P1" /NCGR_SAMPLE_ID=MMETSP0209 /ASSEMBLY_ACC=CAM_ASM_000301 /LENGTH=542 /DNA_ID=CAMNT_0010805413 /DNA_START=150 /DNA_END=1774 /DNA_ORIENTATION=+